MSGKDNQMDKQLIKEATLVAFLACKREHLL